MRLESILIGAIVAVSLPLAARADFVTYNFLGVVSNLDGSGLGESVGKTVSASVTFDTAGPLDTSLNWAPGTFIYDNIRSLSVDGHVSSSTSLVEAISQNVHDTNGYTNALAFLAPHGGDAAIVLVTTTPGPLSILDSTPMDLAPRVSDFQGGSFSYEEPNGGGGFTAHIESVTAFVSPAVPEPSTWAMMLLGFCGLAVINSRRRRTTVSSGIDGNSVQP